MTRPLSPAAQAVLDAANGASSYGPGDCLNDAPQIAAAALYAAAHHLPNDRRVLAGFAAELEAQSNG